MKHATIVLVLLLATRPARAEVFAEAEQLARDAADTAIDRVRRGLAIGPEVGYFGGMTEAGDAQAGLSFGLALYSFRMPSLQRQVLDAARERVGTRLKELVRTGRITNAGAIPAEVLADVKREVAEELRPRTFERPRMKIVVEGALLHAQRGFQARALFGYGLGYLTLGAAAGLQQINDLTMVMAGPEVSVHLTPVGKVRTPVVDLFVRSDFAAGEGERMVAFVGGARVALDIL
ncbi:MAG: hypothetical protein SFX73_26325 [Kofleriaceae bacterium]|nr:hypothetical protein [Kofleriaceae bacterium]